MSNFVPRTIDTRTFAFMSLVGNHGEVIFAEGMVVAQVNVLGWDHNQIFFLIDYIVQGSPASCRLVIHDAEEIKVLSRRPRPFGDLEEGLPAAPAAHGHLRGDAAQRRRGRGQQDRRREGGGKDRRGRRSLGPNRHVSCKMSPGVKCKVVNP